MSIEQAVRFHDPAIHWTVLVGLIAAIAQVSCDHEPNSDPQLTVERDSAGVRIVESTAPAWQPGQAWRLSDEPLLDIGGGETDEYQLFRVQGSVRLDDGTIVVANWGSFQLRYYSPSGQYVASGGRQGGGPGEFDEGPWRVWRSGADSVAAWDVGNRRMSFFDGGGAYGRSVTIRAQTGAFPNAIGLLSDGRIVTSDLATPEEQDHPIGTVFRNRFRYEIYGGDGVWQSEIAELPGFERLVYEWTGRKSTGTGPFGRLAWAAVRNDAFYYTSADVFEVLRIEPGTNRTVLVRVIDEPRPVASRDIANFTAERMQRAPVDPAGRQAWRIWLDEVPYPSTFPSYRGLTVDAQGNIWAELYNQPLDSVPRWMVLDSSGRWLGTVLMPKEFTPHDIGRAYVLGRWRDEDEVEHIRLYELLKPLD